MSDENPPPYSAVAEVQLLEQPISASPEIALPFEHSSSLSAKVLALVSEGKTLDSHFKEVREVASAYVTSEYQDRAVILCQRFEALIWESRNIASIALVAVTDFNEVVLDFLSRPDVTVEDRIKELSNAFKCLQRERSSTTIQKPSFVALIGELQDFHRRIYSEMCARNLERRRQSYSAERAVRDMQPMRPLREPIPPFVVLLCDISAITAFFGTITRTSMGYAQQFGRIAKEIMFSSWIISSPLALTTPRQDMMDTSRRTAPSDRAGQMRPPIEHAESTALPDLVETLLCNLCTFTNRLDVFDTVFAELGRAHDIFVVYLKDGQSVTNQGYRSEIKRLRRHILCVCNALDSYSKARLS